MMEYRSVQGMTAQLCQDALCRMLEELFDGAVYHGQEGKKPLHIYRQDLPIPEDNDVDADTDQSFAPYLIVQMTEGVIPDDTSPQTVEFSLVICAYDTGADRGGWMDVANIKEKIIQRACRKPFFGGAYTIKKPIAWAMQRDDTAPYYYGAVTLSCTSPVMNQDEAMADLI